MTPRARPDGEERLVSWLRGHVDRTIGDDAARLSLHGEFALTVDAQHEGVHLPPWLPPERAARRLLAVNLSDLAAVGAVPRFAALSLAAPAGYPRRRFLRALASAAREHRLRVVGGDSSRLERLSATLTLIGERVTGWLDRASARPGDRLWIGGYLGEAATGLRLQELGARWRSRTVELPARPALDPRLAAAARRAVRRHLQPTPQLELGQWLARQPRVAAIDVSDGLGKDLSRLCRASGVGAEVTALPTADRGAALAAALDADLGDLALAGGEDYVLLFTMPASTRPPARFACHAIGRMTESDAVELLDGEVRRSIAELGYDHLAAAAESIRRDAR